MTRQTKADPETGAAERATAEARAQAPKRCTDDEEVVAGGAQATTHAIPLCVRVR